MCVIIVCNKNRPTEALLRRAMNQNPHGNGIAWRDGQNIRWRKGIGGDELVSLAATVPLPFVVHARIATAGGVTKALCHPFPIQEKPSLAQSGVARSVLFHNGHVSEWRAIAAASGLRLDKVAMGWSDSRALAHTLATSGRFDVLRELSDYNRFAVLSPKSLRMFGSWINDEGVHLSTRVASAAYTWSPGRTMAEAVGPVQGITLGGTADLSPAPFPIGAYSPPRVDRIVVDAMADHARDLIQDNEIEEVRAWINRHADVLGHEDAAEIREQIEKAAARRSLKEAIEKRERAAERLLDPDARDEKAINDAQEAAAASMDLDLPDITGGEG